MSIEAMKQALEALEIAAGDEPHDYQKYLDTITALRTAIEQAERQEPVAYSEGRTLHWHEGRGVNDAQLYTTPPAAPVQEQFGPKEILQMIVDHAAQRQWQGLTDEEVNEWTPEIHAVIHAIEAKLREKNGGQA